MKIKEIVTAIFVLALIGLLTFIWFTPDGLKQAPDISVTTLEGNQIDLKSLQGRPVLVTFWATTCPGCVKEMPHLAELYKELAPRGLEMVALAMAYDPEQQVREMIKIKKPPYKVALDRDGKAAIAFGDVKLTPTTFLISPEGLIVQQKLGEMDMNALHNRIVAMLTKKS